MMKGLFIKIEDFQKVTEYVEDLPISFYKAEKAVEIQRIFRTVLSVEVPDVKPEVKPD